MRNLFRNLGVAFLLTAGPLALPLPAQAQPAAPKLAPRVLDRVQREGMFGLPRTPAEERAATGDEAVLDSLFGAWRDASDPDERAAAEILLYR